MFAFPLGRPHLSCLSTDGFGTIGIAPGVEIMHVKVLGNGGSGSFFGIIQGILYAAENGADIINMSLGAYIDKKAEREVFGGSITAEIVQLKNAACAAIAYA